MKNMKVNTEISYEALKGLISRSTTDERLCVSDKWLRGNKVITIPQYQELRELWNKMVMKYGHWRIIITCGTVTHVYASGLSYKEALRVCRDSRWQHNHNGGLLWDMEIEEDIYKSVA